MAIAGPDDILVGIKDVLGGCVRNAYTIEPASPVYPAAWVFFRQPAITWHSTFDGGYTINATITVAVQGSAEHQQSNIRPYIAPTGDKSIVAAFDAEPSLGVPGVSASILRVEAIGPLGVAGSNVWGATFPLEIFVSPV